MRIFYSAFLLGLFISSVYSQNTSSQQFSSPAKKPMYLNTEFSFSPYIFEDNKKIKSEALLAPGIGINLNYMIGRYTTFSFGLSIKSPLMDGRSDLGVNEEDIIKKNIPAPNLSNYPSGSYLLGKDYYLKNFDVFMYGLFMPMAFEFFFQEYDERYLNFYLGGGLDFIYRHYKYTANVQGEYVITDDWGYWYVPFTTSFSDNASTMHVITIITGGLIFPISATILFDTGFEAGIGTGYSGYTSAYGRLKFKL